MGAIAVVAGAAAAVALVVGAVVRRWPSASIAAPRVPARDIADEVRRHPRAAQVVRARLDPSVLTGLALTVTAALVVLGGLAVGVLLYMVRRDAGFARWDLSAARWGATHETGLSAEVFRTVSLFGGTEGLIVVGLTVAIIESRRIRSRSALAFLLVVILGQNLLANGIKLLVDRARPDINQLTGFSGASFPSGHATAAAAALAAFGLLLSRRRGPTARAVIAGTAAGLAVAVAATRVLLGVHWLTDVMAGLALGWAWFALCSIAFGGRLMRFGQPAVVAEAVTPAVSPAETPAVSPAEVPADAKRVGQAVGLPHPRAD